MRSKLTYDADPIYPVRMVARLERRRLLPVFPEASLVDAMKELRVLRVRERRRSQLARTRTTSHRDRPRWQAIRKDVVRGMSQADVMGAYGITEREYWLALAAGATGDDVPEVRGSITGRC